MRKGHKRNISAESKLPVPSPFLKNRSTENDNSKISTTLDDLSLGTSNQLVKQLRKNTTKSLDKYHPPSFSIDEKTVVSIKDLVANDKKASTLLKEKTFTIAVEPKHTSKFAPTKITSNNSLENDLVKQHQPTHDQFQIKEHFFQTETFKINEEPLEFIPEDLNEEKCSPTHKQHGLTYRLEDIQITVHQISEQSLMKGDTITKLDMSIPEEENLTRKKSHFEDSIPDTVYNKLFDYFMIINPDKRNLNKFLNNNNLEYKLIYSTKRNDQSKEACIDQFISYIEPFPGKIDIQKVKNTVLDLSEFLFKNQSLDIKFEFFCIQLDGNEENLPKIFSDHYKANPSKFEVLNLVNSGGMRYYYIAKFQDFFIDSKISSKFGQNYVELYYFPSYYVFKTHYPFPHIFKLLLKQILFQAAKARLDAFVQLVNDNQVDPMHFEALDASGLEGNQINGFSLFFDELNKIKVTNNFGERFDLNFKAVPLPIKLPPKETAFISSLEEEMFEILNYFTFEEFIFIFFAWMQEKSLVFISNNLKKITRCIAFFTTLFKPFNWIFPTICSVPADRIDMLDSPIPVVIGVNTGTEEFFNNILPRYLKGKNKSSGERPNIYIFLDHKVFYYDLRIIDSIHLPAYDKLLKKIQKLYHEFFNAKSSNFFKINSKKKDKTVKWYFKNINSSSIASNIAKHNKNIPNKSARQAEREKLKAFMKHERRFELIHFIRTFMDQFIVSKLETATTLDDFSTDPSDVDFLRSFFSTQAFIYFVENNLNKALQFSW